MAAEAANANTCISGHMTDSIKISTANLGFSTTASSKSMLLGDCGIDHISVDEYFWFHGYIAISGCRSLSQSLGGHC